MLVITNNDEDLYIEGIGIGIGLSTLEEPTLGFGSKQIRANYSLGQFI